MALIDTAQEQKRIMVNAGWLMPYRVDAFSSETPDIGNITLMIHYDVNDNKVCDAIWNMYERTDRSCVSAGIKREMNRITITISGHPYDVMEYYAKFKDETI